MRGGPGKSAIRRRCAFSWAARSAAAPVSKRQTIGSSKSYSRNQLCVARGLGGIVFHRAMLFADIYFALRFIRSWQVHLLWLAFSATPACAVPQVGVYHTGEHRAREPPDFIARWRSGPRQLLRRTETVGEINALRRYDIWHMATAWRGDDSCRHQSL